MLGQILKRGAAHKRHPIHEREGVFFVHDDHRCINGVDPGVGGISGTPDSAPVISRVVIIKDSAVPLILGRLDQG